MKDEFYEDYKYPRCINARCDSYKVLVGPIFKLIEAELFQLPFFIKKIPVSERAQYIIDNVYQQNCTTITTDYSQFEAHFTPEVMLDCEFQLYDYMTKLLPNHNNFMAHLDQLLKYNICRFKNLNVKILGTRMSGEMNTSLGNGFSNLMLMLYAAKSHNLKNLKCVVEGDDGLFTFFGPAPTEQWFHKLGWTIKLKVEKHISTASFCGLIFDTQELDLVCSPIKTIQTLGWLKIRYLGAKDRILKEMMKAKAMSILAQTPNCPIVSVLAWRIYQDLHASRWRATHLNNYQGSQFRDNVASKTFKEPLIGPRTRELVYNYYGIIIEDQLKIEETIIAVDLSIGWSCPCFQQYVTHSQEHYASVYINDYNYNRRLPILECNIKCLHLERVELLRKRGSKQYK